MDTRFWGPSGWRLLHTITFAYNPETDKSSTGQLFNMLPFVLPCKFCRASLTEYMENDPVEPALETREKLNFHKPRSIGAARRISGVTPSALTTVIIYLKSKYNK